MNFLQIGEYVINLDLVQYCRQTGDSVKVTFEADGGSVTFDGEDAQKVLKALLGK